MDTRRFRPAGTAARRDPGRAFRATVRGASTRGRPIPVQLIRFTPFLLGAAGSRRRLSGPCPAAPLPAVLSAFISAAIHRNCGRITARLASRAAGAAVPPQVWPSRTDKFIVITLKRFLDSNGAPPPNWALECYRASLVAAATFGSRACPPVGQELQESLLRLHRLVSVDVSPEAAVATQREAERQLKQWSDRSAEYLKRKAAEAKELMVMVANTAESVGSRDQAYCRQFSGFSQQLQAIADLEDLPKIKESLVRSSNDLKATVEKMTQESQAAVNQLRAELSAAQARLEESERLAVRDSLTGLFNRRGVELEMQARAQQGRVYSVMVFDLNGFKQINDEFGHAAGDEVLKQFASELKSAFRPTDVVGRWGGDEFIVVLDCTSDRALAQTSRIREWVMGEYAIASNGLVRKVHLTAATGIAEARAAEPADKVIERADAAMYKDKTRSEVRRRGSPAVQGALK